jgi:hypothetical protein
MELHLYGALTALMDQQRLASRSAGFQHNSSEATLPPSVKAWRFKPTRCHDELPSLPSRPPSAPTSAARDAAWQRLSDADRPWARLSQVVACVDTDGPPGTGARREGAWVVVDPCPFYAQSGGQVPTLSLSCVYVCECVSFFDMCMVLATVPNEWFRLFVCLFVFGPFACRLIIYIMWVYCRWVTRDIWKWLRLAQVETGPDLLCWTPL